MSKLPVPVRKLLRRGFDDVAIERVWQRVEERRDGALRKKIVGRAQGTSRWLAIVAAVVVCAAAIAGVTAWRTARYGVPAPVASEHTGEALRLADGRGLEAMAPSANETRSFVLTDGSLVTLPPNGRLEVLENDGRALVVRLAAGEARFDVQPGGPRRWTIEGGVLAVEVVGTRFAVARAASSVTVSVEHGVVLVRGDRVPERVQRLTDGQAITVASGEVKGAGDAPGDARRREAATKDGDESRGALDDVAPARVDAGVVARARPGASMDTGAASPGSSRTAPAGPSRDDAQAWRDLARRGDYASAYGLLGPAGIRSISDAGAVADLLAVADVARLSGHPADAVAPLERVVAEHPDEAGAALAAFTLGRIDLDALGRPGEAAAAFARAIALRVPDGLLEDAFARLVEARSRAGDRDGARRSAEDYRARFPAGAHAKAVARWAGDR